MYAYALFLLGRQDYSSAMLKEKLKKKFPNAKEEEIQEIIHQLQNENIINDERLAENYVRFWSENTHYSKRQMQQKLYQKKLPKELIEEVLNSASIDTPNIIKELCEHKWKTLGNINIPLLKKKEKIIRFLLGKGFEYENIQKILKEVISGND